MDREKTIIGIVKEIVANWKDPRVGIVAENGILLVQMKARGKNLVHEIGKRVKATGSISETRDGFQSISVTDYKVFGLGKDHHDKIELRPEYHFGKRGANIEHI